MKETVKSLGRYFGICGFLGALGSALGLIPILAALGNPQVPGNLKAILAFYGLCIALQAVISAGFVFFSMKLERLLRDGPEIIIKTIQVSIAISVVALAISLYLAGPVPATIFWTALGIAVSLYLMQQVKRLSVEVREEVRPTTIA